MKKFFNNLITFVCLITIAISGYKIFAKLSEYKKADNIYTEIRETKENSNKSLSSINDDYIFWINVDGTNIDYPVVQGEDNDFYLNRGFNKEHLSSGSIFLDYRNNFEADLNSVIYGHHMRNGTMFGELMKFKKEEFFENNKDITITTKNKTYDYEIFAVGVFEADFGYNHTSFSDENEFKSFLDKIMKNSIYTRDIVSSDDKIITLSTCSYEYDDARTAIFAKRK
ncbi:class B sortase [Terrisporobacter sp.]|uniref:class B sortase n=1 Tax=Terrisporobacter sp. TaxID=1965305 RepID=UPI00260B8B2E|nr:class B sortase [Terrisporobacter sp.]